MSFQNAARRALNVFRDAKVIAVAGLVAIGLSLGFAPTPANATCVSNCDPPASSNVTTRTIIVGIGGATIADRAGGSTVRATGSGPGLVTSVRGRTEGETGGGVVLGVTGSGNGCDAACEQFRVQGVAVAAARQQDSSAGSARAGGNAPTSLELGSAGFSDTSAAASLRTDVTRPASSGGGHRPR